MSKPSALPSWMYGDPADVAERKEQGEINRAERQVRERAGHAEAERRQRYGLVGDETVRMINRLRVRELVAAVKEGKR